MEKRYTVAQASEMTGVRSYVLRYWEEELDLQIGRNELGHRFYTGYDIQLFMNIKELKSRGLQLKAIRDLLPRIAHRPPGSTGSRVKLLVGEEAEAETAAAGAETGGKADTAAHTAGGSAGKTDAAEHTAGGSAGKAGMAEHSAGDTEGKAGATAHAAGSSDKGEAEKKILEFQEILERLITQEMRAKNDGEARCRSVDEAIRRRQLARKEAAAASEKKNRRKQRANGQCIIS